MVIYTFGGERGDALFQEDAALEGDLLVGPEEVVRRRPLLLAPPAANQHSQLVVPARARRSCLLAPSDLSCVLAVLSVNEALEKNHLLDPAWQIRHAGNSTTLLQLKNASC